MNVTILYGGASSEHDISLISAAAITKNINSAHTLHLIGITKGGKWYLQDNDMIQKARQGTPLTICEESPVFIAPGLGKNALMAGGCPIPTDVVFPVLHGKNGEDGTVQGLLECAKLPYVGCDVLGSAISMDKDVAKRLAQQSNIPVVPGVVITRGTVNDSAKYDSAIQSAIQKLGFPLFVKPVDAGSSIGAGKATNIRELGYVLSEAFSQSDKVIIEKCVDARELEVAVMGSALLDTVHAYEVGEIVPTHSFYDFDAKYTDKDGAALCYPAKVSPDVRTKILQAAEQVYKALGLCGMTRVDFFIDKSSGELFFNEVNTIPGFTSISMFPKLCECSGIGFTALIDCLLGSANG